MSDLIKILNEKGSVIALVGASDNPAKYGSVIYQNLKGKGIHVLPVNPNRPTILGDKAYPSLAELPEKPDIVNIVTPPAVTLSVLKECLKLKYLNVWLQPGASNEEVETFLKTNSFNYITERCTMAESQPLS